MKPETKIKIAFVTIYGIGLLLSASVSIATILVLIHFVKKLW